MARINQMIKRVQSLNIDLMSELSIEDTVYKLVEKQQEQMYEGIDSDGGEREPEYSPFTIAVKQSKGQRTDVVTLNDTGSFYQKMVATVQGDSYIITSGDEKTGDLLTKYGPDILGLSTPYKSRYVSEDLRPAFMANVRKELKL